MPGFKGRSIFVGAMVVAFASAGMSGVAAGSQDTTSACPLEPLTLPLFDATPAAELAGTPVGVSKDAPFDESSIESAMELIVACINTNDPAYQYAIFTERYLAEQFADPTQTYQPEFERQLSFGPGQEPGTIQLVSVTGILRLDDGRVSVVVELSNPVSTFRDTLVLANVDGVWLIDSVEAFDPPR